MAEIRKLPASTADPTSLDIHLPLGGDRFLSGTLAGIRGDVLRVATYSRVGPSHRLASWVRFLAMSAAYPERPLEALVIGRATSGGRRVTVADPRPARRRPGLPPRAGPRRADGPRRPLRPRHARAAADRLPRPPPRSPRPFFADRDAEKGARARLGDRVQVRRRGQGRAPSPRLGRRPVIRRPGRRKRRAPTRRGRPSRRDSGRTRCGSGATCSRTSESRTDEPDRTRHPRSTSAASCRAASLCSRRAPAPARPMRSRRWRPGTSPTGSRSTTC